MITTVNGSFEAKTSPTMLRPWTWGMAGIGVDQSRDGKTLIVGSLPEANVQTQSFAYNNS